MLKAIMDRIIIRLDNDSPNNIIMPESRKAPNKGVVQSIGERVSLVKVGDHVVFHMFDELPLPDDGLVVIREKSLLGIYDN